MNVVLKEGKRADLILVDDEPTRNISDSLSMKGVWKEGCLIVNNSGSTNSNKTS